MKPNAIRDNANAVRIRSAARPPTIRNVTHVTQLVRAPDISTLGTGRSRN